MQKTPIHNNNQQTAQKTAFCCQRLEGVADWLWQNTQAEGTILTLDTPPVRISLISSNRTAFSKGAFNRLWGIQGAWKKILKVQKGSQQNTDNLLNEIDSKRLTSVNLLTVAISCNLSEGVILGVDSAVTVNDARGGVIKTYENAQKLFQLGSKPIGIAVFGIGSIGARNIGSYIKEFEAQNPNNVVNGESTVEDVVEELRAFFTNRYVKELVPLVEKVQNKKIDQIPDEQKPILGLVVGGFSSHQYLSEVWQILVPIDSAPKSAKVQRERGSFGSNWFSLYDPIFRYVKGYDRILMNELFNYIEKGICAGSPLTPQEKGTILGIVNKYEYGIPFEAMPMDEGVAYVKFLVQMVVNHHRFTVGAPVVGGKARIGLVTYKGEKFQFINGADNYGT